MEFCVKFSPAQFQLHARARSCLVTREENESIVLNGRETRFVPSRRWKDTTALNTPLGMHALLGPTDKQASGVLTGKAAVCLSVQVGGRTRDVRLLRNRQRIALYWVFTGSFRSVVFQPHEIFTLT